MKGRLEDPVDSGPILIVIKDNVRNLRIHKGLSKKKLAEVAGYDRKSLSQFEAGQVSITYNTALKLARALDADFPSLFSRNLDVNDVHPFRPDDYLLVYSNNIKKYITQENDLWEIDSKTWMEVGNISRIVNNRKKNPHIRSLYAIAVACNVELFDLFQRR